MKDIPVSEHLTNTTFPAGTALCRCTYLRIRLSHGMTNSLRTGIQFIHLNINWWSFAETGTLERFDK